MRRNSLADRLNIAERLSRTAAQNPYQQGVVFPAGRDAAGRATYSHLTFQQLDRESDRLARGLREMGVGPGTRLVLMVPPSLEFIALTFALFKAGAVIVLIDLGMGRSNIFRCLDEVDQEGFVAVPIVQAVRTLSLTRFRKAHHNVTVGGCRWFWGGATYQSLRGGQWTPFDIAPTTATDPAAIIFTSGSTGPPKGVLYEHGMFDAQVELLRDFYDIQPGEIDLPGFPLFALFNAAMTVTTVIPDMDPTKPAQVDPQKLIQAIEDHGVTQAFGSPAIWNRVGRYCEEHHIQLPSVRRVISAGAPVPPHVIERMTKALCADGADIHTPYGATESLPVTSISGGDILEQTVEKSRQGAGTCVGRVLPDIRLKIIEITAAPIASLDEARELPNGQIGEIIVRGPATTREYFRRTEATVAAKIPDGHTFWHRMGDVGYLDDSGRLWFCGRKAHVVDTAEGPMYSVRCEAIFNEHPDVFRSALVGVGQKPRQTPVIIVELEQESSPAPGTRRARLDELARHHEFEEASQLLKRSNEELKQELRQLALANPLAESIERFLIHPAFPVDVRHNVKINREQLAEWAEEQMKES